MLKLNTITKIEKCPREVYWQRMDLDSEKGFGIHAIQALRAILQEFDIQALSDYGGVRDKIEEFVDKKDFTMDREREDNLDVLTRRINRLSNFLSFNRFKLIDGEEMYGSYKTNNGEEISVSRDMVIQDPQGRRYSVIVKMNKSDFTYTKGSNNLPSQDMEIYVLGRAFPNTIPAIYSLRAKTDKSNTCDSSAIDLYNADRNYFFTGSVGAIQEMEDRLDAIVSEKISRDCKTEPSRCYMCYLKELCQYDDIDTKIDPVDYTPTSLTYEFTDDQKKVIDFNEGEARVIAGAGSGKTSVLVSRMLRLAREGSPQKILAITFTEKGVREIHDKIQRLLRDDDTFKDEDFEVYTFNGFGYKFVQSHYKECGFEESPKLIDNADKTEVIAKLLDDIPRINGLNYAKPYMTVGKFAKGAVILMKEITDLLKRKNIRSAIEVNEFLKSHENKAYVKLKDDYALIWDLYEMYQDYLKDNHLVEYEDQVAFTLKALENHEDLREMYASMYNHVIIDEFQDTSEDQMLLVKNYLYKQGQGKSLLVCGDDAQSIFSFRDVDVKNILTFKDIYPTAVDFSILENFRSTQEILDFANVIMQNNRDRVDKRLWSSRHGAEPTIEYGNIDSVAARIKDLVDKGEDLRDIAVLSRTRQECVDLHMKLNEMDIDNVVVISNDVKVDNQVQGAIALAKFVDDTNTDEQRLLEGAIWIRKSDNEKFESQFSQQEYIIEETKKLLTEFVDLTADEHEDIDVIRHTWFTNKLRNTFERISPALETVLNKDAESKPSFRRLCKMLSLLGSCNTGMSTESDDRVYDAITISTIHAAKGREWKNVVANLTKMKKPTLDLVDDDADPYENKDGVKVYDGRYLFDPEEVRLGFVAITRAKENLNVVVNNMWNIACTDPDYTFEIPKSSGDAIKRKKK